MLSQEEQEEIINTFLNVIKMKTIIKDKVSICKSCKFNQQNMCLYKLNIPDNIVKNICKYNYKECEACKTLKEFKENVYDCSMKQFEDVVEAIEDKHKYNIEDYNAPEKRNTKIYFYVKLNPFPTYEKTLRVLRKYLKEEDKFYNNEFYNEIKSLYDTSFKFDKKIQRFYTKQRNRIIYEYDKNVDKKNNTKIKFVNHLGREMNKIESVIYIIMQYIYNEALGKLKYKLYSNETNVWINKRIAEANYEDDYSFERFMDFKFPYLPTVEYKKQKPIRNDTDFLNNLDGLLD